jgi:hypothetical protein
MRMYLRAWWSSAFFQTVRTRAVLTFTSIFRHLLPPFGLCRLDVVTVAQSWCPVWTTTSVMNGAGAACESYHQFKVEIAGLVSMRMIMYAKEEARNEVRGKPSTSDNQDNFRILNLYSRSVQAHLTVTEYHVTLYIYTSPPIIR